MLTPKYRIDLTVFDPFGRLETSSVSRGGRRGERERSLLWLTRRRSDGTHYMIKLMIPMLSLVLFQRQEYFEYQISSVYFSRDFNVFIVDVVSQRHSWDTLTYSYIKYFTIFLLCGSTQKKNLLHYSVGTPKYYIFKPLSFDLRSTLFYFISVGLVLLSLPLLLSLMSFSFDPNDRDPVCV